MSHACRWGIIGPGNIARKFAAGLSGADGASLVAVASRSLERAQGFVDECADAFPTAVAYQGEAALLASDQVDAVYIASPHVGHVDSALAAIAAGKAVLVEKPLATNRADAERVLTAARAAGVFCMEAMWTRFLPAIVQTRAWLADGRIGEPRLLRASFGFRCGWNPDHRLLSPDLAGGGILDVGVYPVALALDVFGNDVSRVHAVGHVGATGVDEQALIALQFPSGAIASCDCAVQTQTLHIAEIHGTEGRIIIEQPFWRATAARIEVGTGDEVERVDLPHAVNGYEYEAMAVAEALANGWLEHPHASHADTLACLAVCDQARADLGVIYPFER